MNLRTIHNLQPIDRAPAAIKRQATQLAKKASDWQESWQELTRDREAAAKGDLSDLLTNAMAAAGELQSRECRLIMARAEIHRELIALDEKYRASLSEVRNEVLKEIPEAMGRKHDELVAVGFRKHQEGVNEPGMVTPHLVRQIPEIRDLHVLESDLSTWRNSKGFRQRQTEDLKACESWLQEARKKLASLVSPSN